MKTLIRLPAVYRLLRLRLHRRLKLQEREAMRLEEAQYKQRRLQKRLQKRTRILAMDRWKVWSDRY